MKSVLLGVSGSVAAFRACDIARELMRREYTVRVCLTPSGQKFVTPILMESLTGQPCLVDAFDEPTRGRMAHIDWAKLADVVAVAPATANTLCKVANGFCDNMLTTICVAFNGPIVLAPAMNPAMYASEPVRAAVQALRARAAAFVEPDSGDVACGDQGQGRLASVERIVAAIETAAHKGDSLAGQTVLITSGPTQEPIDDVRYLSNRSSGKMGAALARAAMLLGARAIVISGPATHPLPLGAEVVRVQTAEEMLRAALAHAEEADWIVGAAAVADYRPTQRVSGKIRRSAEEMVLKLEPNPDVLAALAAKAKPGCRLVGFAAEPGQELDKAKEKLSKKGLAAVAVNDVSRPGVGFESDLNSLILIRADGPQVESGVLSKLGCALWLFESLIEPAS
jgi:phosphopantothenoylcysteine decarboxylase/phosphopantothenate--cysteine ligase